MTNLFWTLLCITLLSDVGNLSLWPLCLWVQKCWNTQDGSKVIPCGCSVNLHLAVSSWLWHHSANTHFILTFLQATTLISQLQKSFNLLKSRQLQENQLSPMGVMSSKTPKMEEFQNISKIPGKNFSTNLHGKTISHLNCSKLILCNHCTHQPPACSHQGKHAEERNQRIL